MSEGKSIGGLLAGKELIGFKKLPAQHEVERASSAKVTVTKSPKSARTSTVKVGTTKAPALQRSTTAKIGEVKSKRRAP